MKLRLKLKMYALTASGELLLDPQANPFSSFSKKLLEQIAEKHGWDVTEIEPIEADAEVTDLPALAAKLSAYV